MTGVLKVDNIRNVGNTVNLPVSYMNRRLIQKSTKYFRGGLWNPGNTYYEIPGSLMNLTPFYDNSFIVYTYSCPAGHVWNAHCISHWIFHINGQEYARHNKSGDHHESNSIVRWEFASPGAGRSTTMGYYARQYSSGNHGVHFNGRRYIDGSDSSRGVGAFVSVEEYIDP